jgi:phosphatidylserine/phosphatidylglycerophosphate/cardiolipin synthase-like enzyme
VLRITDPTLIANYQTKLDEFFIARKFGRNADVGAKQKTFSINGTPVQNYFSPIDRPIEPIIATVNTARSSIKFMAFSFTDINLANAMLARQREGVKVHGVYESRNAGQGTFDELFCGKATVESDGNPGTMHHKVIIIDDRIVITGSFNFSRNANENNDENVLIIDNPALAQQYVQEFNKVEAKGRTPTNITCP